MWEITLASPKCVAVERSGRKASCSTSCFQLFHVKMRRLWQDRKDRRVTNWNYKFTVIQKWISFLRNFTGITANLRKCRYRSNFILHANLALDHDLDSHHNSMNRKGGKYQPREREKLDKWRTNEPAPIGSEWLVTVVSTWEGGNARKGGGNEKWWWKWNKKRRFPPTLFSHQREKEIRWHATYFIYLMWHVVWVGRCRSFFSSSAIQFDFET